MKLSERIKDRRKALGLSQQELADLVGYQSGSAINKIEKGQRDIAISKVAAFAQALNVSPYWLMGQDPRKKSRFEEAWEALTPAQRAEVYEFATFVIWRDKKDRDEDGKI